MVQSGAFKSSRIDCVSSTLYSETGNLIVYLLYIPVHIKQQECNDQQQQLEEDVKPSRDALLGKEAEQMLIKALDGFLLVLSEEGDITYVSANVTELLGLNQVRNSIRKRNGMEDSLEDRHLIPNPTPSRSLVPDRYLVAAHLGLCASSEYFMTPSQVSASQLIALPLITLSVRPRGAEERARAEEICQRLGRGRQEQRHVLAPQVHADQPWPECQHQECLVQGHAPEGTRCGERGDAPEALCGHRTSDSAPDEYRGAAGIEDVPHEARVGHAVHLCG